MTPNLTSLPAYSLLSDYSQATPYSQIIPKLLPMLKLFPDYFPMLKLQGDFWQSSSGIDLLQACFESSEVLKGIYVTPRLGANYF